MTFSGFIDIGIGLMLMYLLLSLICTTLSEIFQNAMRWRAKSLFTAISLLIDNPELRAAFYNHGLVRTLGAASRGGSAGSSDVASAAGHPSYIDSRTVATALLDSLSNIGEGRTAKAQPILNLADVETIALAIPRSAIRDVLLTSLSGAKNDLENVKANVARWFDDSMDRLSGRYKRSAQMLSLLLGLAVAVALNADSIAVAKALWHDQSLRGRIVDVAADTVMTNLKESGCSTSAVATPAAEPGTADVAREARCLIGEFNHRMDALRAFPIGWPDAASRTDSGGKWFLLKIMGLLWTALALTLGATFWFDMLQKVIGLRGAGPKPKSLSGTIPDAP